jgi:DNA uptake protein ComE-like DNA-binding protein
MTRWARAFDLADQLFSVLQMLKSYGPFKSVDDLLAIRGLGPKRFEKMRRY